MEKIIKNGKVLKMIPTKSGKKLLIIYRKYDNIRIILSFKFSYEISHETLYFLSINFVSHWDLLMQIINIQI